MYQVLDQRLRRLMRTARILVGITVVTALGAAVTTSWFVVRLSGERVPIDEIVQEAGNVVLLLFLIASAVVLLLGLAIVLVFRQLEVVQLQLHELAMTDALTGVHNRYRLIEELDHLVAEYERYGFPFSVLMLDLDHFKSVNDRYGHRAGDAVLQAFVERLREGLRSADRLFRYGGEEFVVLTPHTPKEEACRVAERLRTLVRREPFPWRGERISITVSVGVAAVEDCAHPDAWLLLDRADRALYCAKERGRDQVCVAGVVEVPVQPLEPPLAGERASEAGK